MKPLLWWLLSAFVLTLPGCGGAMTTEPSKPTAPPAPSEHKKLPKRTPDPGK